MHSRIPDIWSTLVLTGLVMEVVVSPGVFTMYGAPGGTGETLGTT